MDHEKTQEILHLLNDPEIGQSERIAALAHLHECSSCAGEWDRWKAIQKAFFQPAEPPMIRETDAFVDAVMSRVALEETPEAPAAAWGAGWLMPAVCFASAALFASIVWPRMETLASPDLFFLMDNRTTAVAELVLPSNPINEDIFVEPEGK